MNVIAIVPATLTDGHEMSVLAPLAGRPLLGWVLERLARVDKLSGRIVVTSDDPRDESVAQYCATCAMPCLKGPPGDVLGWLLTALKDSGAKGGVMVDARSPLIDPALVDHVVNLLQMTDGMLDWIGNTLTRTYPQGMEIDGFTAAALTESSQRADPESRRQGPAFLRSNSRLYRPLSVTAPPELARPQLSLRADGAEDLRRLESLLAHAGGGVEVSLAALLAAADAA